MNTANTNPSPGNTISSFGSALENISIDSLTSWICLGLLLLLVFATIIAGVLGLMKGLLKTALKTVLKAILVTIAVFATPYIANGLSTLKVIPWQGENVNLQVLIADWITNLGIISPTNGLTIYETAIAIANALLAYAVFLVLLILIGLFISLITGILYNGIFRWFLPVESRKERKWKKKNKTATAIKQNLATDFDDQGKPIRKDRKLPLLPIPGMLLGAAQEFIFVLALLAPITSLARIGTTHQDAVKKAMAKSNLSPQTQEQLDASLTKVSESPLFKMTSLTNFDTAIMSKAGTITLNTTSLSLNRLLSSLFDIASPLLDSSSITYDEALDRVTLNYAELLSTQSVSALLTTFAGNKQIMALIPPLIDVGLNAMKNTNLDMELEGLDFQNISWSDDIRCINEIYSMLYSDVLRPIISQDGKSFTPDHFVIPVTRMSDEEIDVYAKAAHKAGTLSSVKKISPLILAKVGSYLEKKGNMILPSDPNAYEDIDYPKEFELLTSAFFRMMRLFGLDISAKTNFNSIPDRVKTVLSDDTKRAELALLVIGDESQGLPGVLDSEFALRISLPDAMDALIRSIPALAPYISQVDFKSVFKDFAIQDFKSEIRVVLSVAGSIYQPGSGIDISHPESIDFSSIETVDRLSDLITQFERSRLFSTLYPTILKSVLFHVNINFRENFFGLTPYSFNYQSKDFLKNIKSLLHLIPDIRSMVSLFSDSSKSVAQKIDGLNVETIRQLLVLITSSDFFNADFHTGTSSEAQKNLNLKTLFEHLYQQEPFRTIGLVAPSITDLQQVEWGSGKNDRKEIAKLCDILQDIQANIAFFSTDQPKPSELSDTKSVASLIKDCTDSKIAGPSALKIISNSMQSYFDSLGIPIDLNHLRNDVWKDDADDIATLLSLLQDTDIDHLDVKRLNGEKLNVLLTTVSEMKMLQSISADDPLGTLLCSSLKKLDLYTTLDCHPVPDDIFDSTLTEEGVASFRWKEATAEVEIHGKTYLKTSSGTIADLSNLLNHFQEIGFDKLKKGSLPSGLTAKISPELNDSFIRAFLADFLSQRIAKLDFGPSYNAFLQSIDFSMLKKMDQSSFQKELTLFEDLFTLSTKKDNSGESILSSLFKDIYSLSAKTYPESDPQDKFHDQTYEQIVDTLLDEFATSELLTQKSASSPLCPLALFWKEALDQAGLTDKLIFSKANKEGALSGILSNITDWSNEMSSVKTILNLLQGKSNASLTLTSTTLSYEEAKAMLTAMNRSMIFHRLPITLFRDAFDQAEISGLLVDPATGLVPHPLSYRVHLTISAEDIAYWQNDIDHLLEIVYHSSLTPVFENGSSLSAIRIGDLSNLDFLYDIGSLNLFAKSRSYLLLNLMDSYSTDQMKIPDLLKRSSHLYYGENEKATRLEELFFQNPKLLDATNHLDESRAKHDLAHLSLVLKTVLENAASFATISSASLKDISVDFLALNNGTYEFAEDHRLIRSDLTSEIVAGLEKTLLTNHKLTAYFGDFDLDLYADDHALINSIEGRGLNGIIELSKLGSASPLTKAQLTDAFTLFGAKNLTGLSDQEAYDHLLSLPAYQETGNSLLVRHFTSEGKEIVLNVVVTSTSLEVGRLFQFLAPGEDSSHMSYRDLLASSEIL